MRKFFKRSLTTDYREQAAQAQAENWAMVEANRAALRRIAGTQTTKR